MISLGSDLPVRPPEAPLLPAHRKLQRLAALTALLACLQAFTPPLVGGSDRPETGERRAPRVALVLSGGGARGMAHIGVLKVLEEMRVPVDLIVGTSMGAVIGGLYATGWSPGEIERLILDTDFRALFVDYPNREDASFRRKLDDREFLIPVKLRFKDFLPYMPPAALGGQRLENFLRAAEIRSTGRRDFDAFPIAFRAVAADLTTGEAVVLGEGSLATALRASMAMAGMFSPVVIDGRTLVDGGAAANLPIGIAQELGARRVIAVDITTPLEGEGDLGSFFSILDQMSTFLTVGNRKEDLERLRPGDVLISPELGEIGAGGFERAGEAIARGEAAARAAGAGLEALQADEEEYARFQERHRRRPLDQVVIDEVRIHNSSWVADEVVRKKIDVPVGEPLDVQALKRDIRRLHALDYFGIIRPSLDRIGGREILTLDTPLKPYGRNSLQFGVNFRDDFAGDVGYALAMRHQLLAINRRGGEWQNVVQIGDTSLFESLFYQPLDTGMMWFVEPGVSSRRWAQPVWVDGDLVAEYRVGSTSGRLDMGRVLGRWGEARVGAFISDNFAERRIGDPLFPDLDQRDGGLRFRFRVDNRDDVVFPERGLDIDAVYSKSLDAFGADAEFTVASARLTAAMSFGRNTLVPALEGGTLLKGPETLNNSFSLGGFLRLSGLETDELIGSRYGLAVLLYYRELTAFNLGALSPKLYAGCSLEAGNTFFEGDEISRDTLEHSGTVFVGGRTPVGPVYLGYALADGGRSRIYFNLGARF